MKKISVLLVLVLLFMIVVIFGMKAKSSLPADVTEDNFSKISTNLRTVYKTNSWFSSAYKFPSSPMFVHPGAYQITEKGLGISVPQVKGTEKTIFGSYDELCVVGSESPFSTSKVLGYGDWNVNLQLGDLTVSLVQGSPVTYFQGIKEITITCIGAEIAKNNHGVLVKRGSAVLLFQSENTNETSFVNESTFKMKSVSDRWRVSILPELSEKYITLFGDYAWNRIINTEISYDIASVIRTSWAFRGEKDVNVLTTVWPHHGDVKDVVRIDNAFYKTVLGDIQLVESQGFSALRALPKLDFSFTKVTSTVQSEQIKQAISEDAKRYLSENPPEGVYFKGTWLGALTSLIQLADTYGMVGERDQLLNKLESILKGSLSEFEYDENLHLLKAKKPEFGNEYGNDHHFHYGYYIRASAVLAKFKPQTLEWSEIVISEMVGDIAFFGREKDNKYPFLRYFSPYEGHSWADGRGSFADGNNQESTSEALNAWYAIKMWGEVIGDLQLVERGTWLFAEELEATSRYWFGKNNQFAFGYSSPIASLVWGGKRDFSTWFSPDPMHIIGIQVLPITPASEYLGSVGNSKMTSEYLSEKSPGLFSHEWADLYFAYLSYSDPNLSVPKDIKRFEGLKLKSLYYQTIGRNNEK